VRPAASLTRTQTSDTAEALTALILPAHAPTDSFGLWPDKRLLRGFQRCVQLVSEIDLQEYSNDAAASKLAATNVNEISFLSQQVIEPAYQMLSFYLRHLAVAYDNLPKGRERDVPGLREIFGSDHSQLPGKVIR
jgi:hypothetical protein